MISKDMYGKNTRFFVGVVKDINDPLSSNRVRVRIFGVHPDDPDAPATSGFGSPNPSLTPTTTTSNTGGGSTSSPITLAPIKIDESKLPNTGELDAKISKHFTLGQLSIHALFVSQSTRRGYKDGMMTQEHVKNLANLAQNALDPIKEKFPSLVIHSGWRYMSSAADRGPSGGNHPKGYAADISTNVMSVFELANWIKENMKGRYTMMLLEYSASSGWVHLQLGGKGSLENPIHLTIFTNTGQTMQGLVARK